MIKQDMQFNDYDSLAKGQNKTIRQVYKEQQATIGAMYNGNADLLDGYAKDTQYFHDSKFHLNDASAGVYPVDAFQILDLTVNLPLNKFWAQDLVPMRMGGGAVESYAFFRSNIGLAEARLAGGNSNSVPLVSISDEKIVVPIYPIRLGILLGEVDLIKSEQVNYGILDRHESALRTSYWREIEYFAMQGNVNIGDITTSTDNFFPGILNIPTSGAGIYYKAITDAQWSTYGITDWTTLFITAVATMKQNVRYQRDYFINTIALPPTVWTLLQAPAVIGSGTEQSGLAVSIMEYITKEINRRLQVEVNFVELPYLDAGAKTNLGFFIEESGANSTGRILLYRKDEKVSKLPIAMPLTGGAMLPSPTEGGFRKNYLAFVGPLALVYPESYGYIDNKAA